MVAIPMRHDAELTGQARVRAGWRGKLVLQVQVRTIAYSALPAPPGRNVKEWREHMRSEGYATLSWRDATWADMQALTRLDLVPAGRIEPPQPWPRGPNVNPPPDYPRPPAPPGPPPMADMVGYPGTVCMEHYYGGCPNCGRGRKDGRA